MISHVSITPAAATGLVITLDRVKQQCKIDGTDFDDQLQDIYMPAALEWAENGTHRAIEQRSHTWVIRDFPRTNNGILHMPRGKAQSVTSIVYYSNGSPITLTGPTSGSPIGTDYQELLTSDAGGILMPNRGESWPTVDDDVPAPITITYSAGWATADIPLDLVNAMLLYISDALNVPGTADFGTFIQPADLAYKDTLLIPWRAPRWV